MYKEEKEIASTLVDLNLECKLSALFLLFQDLATSDAEQFGAGKSNTIDKGLHWIITRFDVEIIRMPRYLEKVVAMSYPGDNNPLFFNRYFVIEDLKGNVLVKAVSVWAVIDFKNHSLVKNPFPGIIFPTMHRDDELPTPRKLSGSADNIIYSRIISYSDIDLNSHLNNTRYIELIQDSFDISFYKKHCIKSISINYLQELRAGDEVSLYQSSSDNKTTIIGRKDDKDHFISEITYIDR